MLRRKFWGILHNKHNVIVVFICVLLCFVSVGYAALTANLNIDGLVNVTSGVCFTNIRVFGGGVTPITATNISDITSVSFKATLNQPGDFYKFLIDVENKRPIDMMIKNVIYPIVSDNVEFIATYKDGTPFNANDLLLAGEKKTLLIILRYKDGVTPSTITENITFTIEYDIADSSGRTVSTDYTVDDFINITNGVKTESYANNSVQAEMYAFEHPATEQLEANTDYRYIGNAPDNYIKFNTYNGQEEMWRIIGVFQNSDGENRLKIIRDYTESALSTFWDAKNKNVSALSGYHGSSDWTDAQLMYFLNPDDIAINVALKTGYTFDGQFVKDASGNIIYEKGKLPTELTDETITYDGVENDWRVNINALTKVDSVTYYLGGRIEDSTTHYGSAIDIYNWERGTNVYSGNSINWTGKVGLMYPSDYGYTFAKGIENKCFNDPGKCYTLDLARPDYSWLYRSSDYSQWTISPKLGAVGAFYVAGTGIVTTGPATNYVRPVVHLNSNVKLSGSGTSIDPYVIK